jgi:hypothetical protein
VAAALTTTPPAPAPAPVAPKVIAIEALTLRLVDLNPGGLDDRLIGAIVGIIGIGDLTIVGSGSDRWEVTGRGIAVGIVICDASGRHKGADQLRLLESVCFDSDCFGDLAQFVDRLVLQLRSCAHFLARVEGKAIPRRRWLVKSGNRPI